MTGPVGSPDPAGPMPTSVMRAMLARIDEAEPNVRRVGRGGLLAVLLPSLEPARVVSLGAPPAAVRHSLEHLLGPDRIVVVDDPAAVDPDPDEVLWVTGEWLLAHGAAALPDAARAAAVVIEHLPGELAGAVIGRLQRPDRPAVRIETAVLGGGVVAARLAVPGATPLTPPVAPAVRSGRWAVLQRWRRPTRGTLGSAVLASGDPAAPPAWLVDMLDGAGIDATGTTWQVDAPGVYDSQKVLIRLTAGDGRHDPLIVKLTRDARMGPRLHHEAEALRWLAADPALAGVRAPRVLVDGPVGRVWAAVETLEPGRPLPIALRSEGPDRLVPTAIDALTALAVGSRRPAHGATFSAPMAELVARYAELYRPTPPEIRALDAVLRQLADATEVPVVATHGDPGAWNMLAGQDGTVVILDWESFEPDGVPLWDLWHLLRALAFEVDRGRLPRSRLAVTDATFLGDGRATERSIETTARYRRAVGVGADAVVPLFVLTWLHRAVKEASRLAPERIAHGHYGRFLRQLLAPRNATRLRRLEREPRD